MLKIIAFGVAMAALVAFTIMLPVSAQTTNTNDPASFERGMFQIKGIVTSYTTSTASTAQIGLNGLMIPIRLLRLDQGVSLQGIVTGERVEAWGEMRNGYPVITRIVTMGTGNATSTVMGDASDSNRTALLQNIQNRLQEIRSQVSRLLEILRNRQSEP